MAIIAAEVYIYPGDCDDFTTIGLCGCLEPTSCLFEEVGNGLSELTLTHPLDRYGKYKCIQNDCILSAMVPVRTTPEIKNGQTVTHVETYTIKVSATKDQRYIYSAAEKGSKLHLMSGGESVTVTDIPAKGNRYKIKSGKYAGWIDSAALDRSTRTDADIPSGADGIETVAPAWRDRLQLFRIYKVSLSMDGGIKVSARHISYDLVYNITRYDTDGIYTLQDALTGIVNACIDRVPFYFYTNINGTHTGAHYRDCDPITALLDPDKGLCAKWNAKLVRDNNELYLLDRAGLNRGVILEYGKDLTGVDMTPDQSVIATRIRPRGTTQDGEPLYLDESQYPDGCVDSPLRYDYPIDRILTLEVPEAAVSKDMSVDTARQLMVDAANAKFASGADKAKISVSVQFDLLGNSERYSQYRALESVYLYDTVGVLHPHLGININVDVVRTVWDCLRGKMQAVELGELQALTSQVSSWQLSGGISGSKLMSSSVDASKISPDAVSTRHIQAESINADKIQAGAVTAEKLNANELKAHGATIDELKAAFAEITGAYINELTAGSIAADTLAAALAKFGVITAGSADFDRETVKHLIASALNVQDATGDKVFIKNLAVDYANMVNAYVGNLCVKASDGYFYKLNVNPDGTVSAERTTATEAEQAAGVKETGEPIIETSLTVSDLSASDLKAVYALINKLDAARIDVGTLTAGTAFINFLRTADIASNKSIQFALANVDANTGDLSEIKRFITFEDDGLTQRVPGSDYFTGVTNSGFDVRYTKAADPVVSINADDGLKTDRIKMGDIICRKTSAGGWVWQANN